MDKLKQLLWNSRVKSFLWRSAMMALAGLLAIIVESLGVLELSPQITAIVGLILGEISKWINTTYGNPK